MSGQNCAQGYRRVLSELGNELSGLAVPGGISLAGGCEPYKTSETLRLMHGTRGNGTMVLVHGKYFLPRDGQPGNGRVDVRYEQWERACAKQHQPCHRRPADHIVILDETADTHRIAEGIVNYIAETTCSSEIQCRECKRSDSRHS